MGFTALGDIEFNAKNIRFNVQDDMDIDIGKTRMNPSEKPLNWIRNTVPKEF